MRAFLFLLIAPFLLASCGHEFYARVKPGKFYGKCTLEAVGVDHQNDYPLYLLRQDAGDPFRFVRYNGEVIQPRTMLTSGGNVPWFVQFGAARNPGTYWDAYVIHDWLFDAHRRRLREVSRYSIEEAAMILAEAQKTMIETGRSRILESQSAYGHGAVKSSRHPAFRDTFAVYSNYVAAQTPFARVPWMSHRYEPVAEQYQVLGIPLPKLRRSARVAIHLAAESQRDEAEDLAYRMAAAGIIVGGIDLDRPGTSPARLEVRHARPDGRLEAARIAAFLDTNPQFGHPFIRQFPSAKGSRTRGEIEVWYPHS